MPKFGEYEDRKHCDEPRSNIRIDRGPGHDGYPVVVIEAKADDHKAAADELGAFKGTDVWAFGQSAVNVLVPAAALFIAPVTGLYEISLSVQCTIADAVTPAGTLTLTALYTDPVAGASNVSRTNVLTTINEQKTVSQVWLQAGTAVTYGTSISTVFGTAFYSYGIGVRLLCHY